MSALYVDALAHPVTVSLDGPSLLLRREGRAEGRYPLRRLTRLVLRGPVTLDGLALAACLRAGIGLAVVDAEGRGLGTCLPAAAKRADTAALLDEVALAGRLPEVLDAWHRAEERDLITRMLLRLDLRPPDLRRRTLERHLAAWIDARGPFAAEGLLMRLEGLLDAQLACWLVAQGLGCRWQGGLGGATDLRRLFRALLLIALWPLACDLALYLARHAGKHRTEAALQRRVVRRFEAESPQIERRADLALARLRRCLREALL